MKFWEAMKALEEGKKVQSLDWPENEYYHLVDESIATEENKHIDAIYTYWDGWRIYKGSVSLEEKLRELETFRDNEHEKIQKLIKVIRVLSEGLDNISTHDSCSALTQGRYEKYNNYENAWHGVAEYATKALEKASEIMEGKG